MNSPITFPPPEPSLKLVRPSTEKWTATLMEERRRLQEDQEALREREENLQKYEARLRALQSEIEAGRKGIGSGTGTRNPLARASSSPTTLYRASQAPFHEDPALQSAWEKLHRAREIFEAEQKNLRDDRILVREQEAEVKRREEALALREQRLAEREALVAAATPPPRGSTQHSSTMSRITHAPFDMALSMLRGRK